MVKDIDDIADERTRGIQTGGDEYYDEFLFKRPKAEWAAHIDETAKDISAGIQISDLSLSKENFGREVGDYYRRGLKQTTGHHADLPSVLDDRVSDKKLGLLAYQLNEFSYKISDSDLGIKDVETATEAIIEKILTRHIGQDLGVSFDLSGATVADITTQLFKDQTVASNVDLLLSEFEESTGRGLLPLMDEPQMMTPLWEHQRDALAEWFEHGKRGYVDMATATGKTVLGLSAIALQYGRLHPEDQWMGGLDQSAPETENKTDEILIVAHSELILEQWRREFETHLNIPQERTTGGTAITLEWGTIHFRTAQSLINQDQVSYDLVLLDEAHHYATGSEWGSLLNEFNGKILAMSGSVDDAGSDSERIKDRLTNSIGPELSRYTITEARTDGVIPSFDWEVHYAPYDTVGSDLKKGAKRSERAFSSFQKQLSQKEITVDTDRRLRTYEDLRNFSHTNEGSDLKKKNDTFRDLVTRLFSRRTKRWNLSPVIDSVIDLIIEHHTNEKVVVLADSNAQVEEIESRLQDILNNPASIHRVAGSQSLDEQHEVIAEFDEPESTGVLLGTGNLLGEGVDMQRASVAINMATGGVNQELVQRIGRVLRNPADTPKHAMFYNVVGIPPSEAATVSREDGKQMIEQAAGFCSLGHRFDKLPGFSISGSLDTSVINNLLNEGSDFIHSIDSDGQYTWNKKNVKRDDLVALLESVDDDRNGAETILGKWEEYAWEQSKDDDEIAAGLNDNESESDKTNGSEPPTRSEGIPDEITADSSGGKPDANSDDLNSSTSDEELNVVTPKRGLNKNHPRREKLLSEIKTVKDEIGAVPSKQEMSTHGSYSINDFEAAFGTWSNAVRDAGLEPRGSQKQKYTRKELISELKRVAEDIKKPPSVDDINEHAELSATIVYNYFDSIDDARTAAGVEDVEIKEGSTDPEATDSQIDPNPLSEYYEVFCRLHSLIEQVTVSNISSHEVEDTHVLRKWENEVEDIAFGDGLTVESSNYGEQQSSRNSHTMERYREKYGNGQQITEYQCIDTASIGRKDREILADQQIVSDDEEVHLPVAVGTDAALPVIVSTEEELDDAIELIGQFPAKPHTTAPKQSASEMDTKQDNDTDSGSGTTTVSSGQGDTPTGTEKVSGKSEEATEIFWDETVDPVTEYEEAVGDIRGKPPQDGDSIDSKIDEWRSQLLDLTRRNSLISFRSTKTKSLPFEETGPTVAAAELNQDSKLYIHKRVDEESDGDTGGSPKTKADNISTNELVPTRVETEAKNSLNQIGITNKRYLRERGVDSLYLSLGMLRWYSVDHSDEANRSPLFLAPVELQENPIQDSNLHDYTIKLKSDGILLNPALRKKLAAERSLDLPADEALSLGNIDAAFESVYQLVGGFDRWAIESDVIIGIFDFTKFSLYSDLERNRPEIKNNPIVQALNGEMGPLQQTQGDIDTPRASELDDVVDPVDTYQVLDADSSQQEAIEAAKRGKSFVLQGPPGTGKSQTIANIITEKIAEGERVLFVSEKQAALNVVKNRLDNAGVGRFCLEVHGEKANNKDVLESLEAELKSSHVDSANDRRNKLQKLKKRRTEINEHGDLLFFSPDRWDLTVYQAYGIVGTNGDAPRVRTGIKDPLQFDENTVTTAIDELETLARFDDEIRSFRSSPWRHTTLKQWGIDTGDSMRRSIDDQITAIESLKRIADTIESKIGVRPQSLSSFRETQQVLQHLSDRPNISWQHALFDESFLQSGEQLEELAGLEKERNELASDLFEDYQEGLLSVDGSEIGEELADYGLLKSIQPSYRSVKKKITKHTKQGYNPGHNQLVEDTKKLAEVQRIESQREMYEETIEAVDPFYEGGDTDWDTLVQAQSWITDLFQYNSSITQQISENLTRSQMSGVTSLAQETQTALQEYDRAAEFFDQVMAVDQMAIGGEAFTDASLSNLSKALQYLRGKVPRLQRRVQFASQLDVVQDTACEEYINRFLQQEHEPEHLVSGFKKQFYTQWLNSVYKRTNLGSFNADRIEGYLEDFQQLDKEQQAIAQIEVQHEVTKRRPTFDFDQVATSDRATLRREIEKERKHKPLRELFEEAASLITQLTPCFMMSPLSVAQNLKSDSIEFDTVVFDEASQIMPQDAVSSLIRADQAVIAGDSNQLPPTSFFQSDVETTEDVREDLDSILEETASVLPEKTLRWHYRSRAEELIQFSNHHYYNNSLRTFPQNEPEVDTGVDFEYVEDGTYDRGGSRQNRIEAERVVELIKQHAENHNNKSLGVVAFSSAQEQAIRDLVADRRQKSAVLDQFVNQDDVLEEFFIKNLEMVQGDERDRMIFSVGYGPAQDGSISTNFGPLNKSGGERRLNVAVTRAKEKVTVVCSMQPGDIDLSNSNSVGAQHFKNYLEYAKSGKQALTKNNQVTATLDFDSQFEQAVYDALQKEGYDVVSQVQSSSYSIDLAIKHPDKPGKFMLGIECDGAAYHSSKTARDRDRTRQLVLENLGWNIHRIWSPDWASNEAQQIQKIHEKVDSLTDADQTVVNPPDGSEGDEDPMTGDSSITNGEIIKYVTPSMDADSRYSPSSVGGEEANKNSIEDVVAHNGPIKYETAIQTYLQVWSESEITNSVEQAFSSGVNMLKQEGNLFQQGEFLWPQEDDLDFKVRVNTKTSSRHIEEIPIEEIAKASKIVLDSSDRLDKNELITETKQLLGYEKERDDTTERIKEAIDILGSVNAVEKTTKGHLEANQNVAVDSELLSRIY